MKSLWSGRRQPSLWGPVQEAEDWMECRRLCEEVEEGLEVAPWRQLTGSGGFSFLPLWEPDWSCPQSQSLMPVTELDYQKKRGFNQTSRVTTCVSNQILSKHVYMYITCVRLICWRTVVEAGSQRIGWLRWVDSRAHRLVSSLRRDGDWTSLGHLC